MVSLQIITSAALLRNLAARFQQISYEKKKKHSHAEILHFDSLASAEWIAFKNLQRSQREKKVLEVNLCNNINK